MKLVIFSNILNHHQINIADELYQLLGDDFKFVATCPFNKFNLKGGLDYSDRSYYFNISASENDKVNASRLAIESEVCVFGACSQEYAIERAKHNPNGLSFEMAERWLKKGWINAFSSSCRRWWLNYMRYYRKASFYKLCMSAFTAKDDELLGCYKGKHFKWGYFTSINTFSRLTEITQNTPIRLLWCGRFLKLKHPELVLNTAAALKKKGYKFQMEMVGDGEIREGMEALANKLGVWDVVVFCGNLPNSQVLDKMSNSDIFLFTSDKKEGWGAVVNEAMSQRCVVVASDEIGSVPYLIKDGINGLHFKSGELNALVTKVQWLIEHPEEMNKIKEKAHQTILETWSPKKAAHNLLQLIDDLQNGKDTSILEGPGSKA